MIATGKLTTYPGTSKYQIVIDELEPAGVGALMALLEERRRKLAAEGLFDAGAQAAAAVPAAGDRRRHLADRRGDPRHPAPARATASRAACCVWPVRVQGETLRPRRSRRRSAASTRCAAAARSRGPTC